MAESMLQTLLAQPAVPDPPRRVWRDWVLVSLLVPAIVLEGVFGDQTPWRAGVTIAFALLALTLLWRRTHPLAMMAIAFGGMMVVDQSMQLATGEPVEFFSMGFLLLLPYAVFRWGSGRDAAIGAVLMVVILVFQLATNWTGVGDAIGGTLVLIFPAVLGVEVRHLVGSRARDLHEVKVREREMLARELHDTVAHHVSAIAIQAQAGQVVGANRPGAALDALAVIEREASRTLVEMRSIVGSLRGAEPAELAPQPGIDDLVCFARGTDSGPRVAVTIDDALGDVGPTMGTALYRVAQEAVTNARRHARHATCIDVSVVGDGSSVRLVVDDDGAPVTSAAHNAPGFGLTGMAERAHLLGGSFEAGPLPTRGWRVEATIPRTGAAS